MKRTNKAFTIVEVIIVIAVIGILAAILVLALPKAIEEAHEKSALSDAKNTLTETAIETDPADKLNKNYIIIVEKYEKEYVFSCEDGGEITPYELNPFGQSVRRELADALCDMGLVQAPLGLNEVTLTEQFSSVTLFTGGKLQSPQRIDVEVNCDTDLPNSGILNVTWKTENTSIASVHEGKIHGKAVGKTVLTGMCDDIRIAYSLYVGKCVVADTFADIKAACEDDSDSVFIYPSYTDDEQSHRYNPAFDELPVTIREGKHVSLCSERKYTPDTEPLNRYYNMLIVYSYSNAPDPDAEYPTYPPVEAIFINDGGIFNLDNVFMINGNCSTFETGFMPYTGNCIINKNGGKICMRNDTEVNDDSGLPISNWSLYKLPIPESEDDLTKEMDKAIAEASGKSKDFALVNESGEVVFHDSFCSSVKNCMEGKLDFSVITEKVFGFANRIQNEGTIYRLDGYLFFAGGTCDYKSKSIINTGTIYELKNSEFRFIHGGSAIESSGVIFSISDCTFKAVDITMEQLTGTAPERFNLSEEQAQEYLSRPAVPIRISGGKIGEIVDCEFDCTGIVFDGCAPFNCIRSGKFREKPDGVLLYNGSECIHDEDSEMYVVRDR